MLKNIILIVLFICILKEINNNIKNRLVFYVLVVSFIWLLNNRVKNEYFANTCNTQKIRKLEKNLEYICSDCTNQEVPNPYDEYIYNSDKEPITLIDFINLITYKMSNVDLCYFYDGKKLIRDNKKNKIFESQEEYEWIKMRTKNEYYIINDDNIDIKNDTFNKISVNVFLAENDNLANYYTLTKNKVEKTVNLKTKEK